MALPDNLRRIRKEKHISQEELAEELNVSRQAISKWEQGICLPEAKMLLLISEKLNVSIDDLMSDSLNSSVETDAFPREITVSEPRQGKKKRKILILISAILIVAVCVIFIMFRPGKTDDNTGLDQSTVENSIIEDNTQREPEDNTPREPEVFTTQADRDRIFELSCEFAEAYFAQDFDSIRLFLSTDFVSNPKDTSPWAGIDTYFVRGVDSISTEKANGVKVISIEFRNPDYPDSFIYLTVEFVKQDSDWKVHSYYMDA